MHFYLVILVIQSEMMVMEGSRGGWETRCLGLLKNNYMYMFIYWKTGFGRDTEYLLRNSFFTNSFIIELLTCGV